MKCSFLFVSIVRLNLFTEYIYKIWYPHNKSWPHGLMVRYYSPLPPPRVNLMVSWWKIKKLIPPHHEVTSWSHGELLLPPSPPPRASLMVSCWNINFLIPPIKSWPHSLMVRYYSPLPPTTSEPHGLMVENQKVDTPHHEVTSWSRGELLLPPPHHEQASWSHGGT